jgi:transposase-like protein
VDAVCESLRRHGAQEPLLVGWGIAADGGKHLLHLAVGNKESEACGTESFRSLLNRGLRLPTTVTSDGAPGLVKAITVCSPPSIRIRFRFLRRGQHPRQAARRWGGGGDGARAGRSPTASPTELN